ncbi:hypothetical protein JM946_19710 [Steroidobacter sp. S1-65]|uniref:Uncharacterized protein n=1 Tax=Steroidobacter gossypii TaxID=2805490 RepID=A0ABS1X181_9GAMM|nr:hypothetical protein [Steroidobacter gossypii]MBM0106969.1 hypothetical protein [Steroidobacter gossypii]
MKLLCRWILSLGVFGASHALAASAAPFDLVGPTLEVTVSRGETVLPIAQAPHLASGDKLWIKADFPENQSEHYLLVVSFLRGPTNPPPKDWFFRCETWKKKKRSCGAEGLSITVPDGAKQALIFLAPEDGGDFKTLVNAVRGRPGAFVRATQDLNQATLDRSRLERYLSAIRQLNAANPAVLKDTTPLLARSLGIQVDQKCLDRLPQLQAPCLMEGQDTLILNDGHSVSIVEALTTGPASDLLMTASATREGNYGYYSPYISSLLDLGRLFDSFRVANYQYIPALATAVGSQLTLTLNTPPSFHDPKSVLTAALPAIEKALPPPLHAVSPKDIYCARKDSLVLPVEGAPLVFATEYAHNTFLRVTGKNGEVIELPATADATRGGFVVDTSPLGNASLADRFRGSLHGYWGFEKFDGPAFQLVNTHTQTWTPASPEDQSLIVGRANTIHLQAGSVACIDRIMVKDPTGKELRVDWSPVKANEVEINLPLQQAQPGALTLFVSQYGVSEPQPLELRAYPEAGRFESFAMHEGETHGMLKGSRLGDVASLSLQGVVFVPTPSSTMVEGDSLRMEVAPPSASDAGTEEAQPAPKLQQGTAAKAKVTLRDGRSYTVNVSVAAPRPSVELVGKSVQASTRTNESNISLASEDQLPQDAQLIFSVRAKSPAIFSREANIEVASQDEAFATTLSLANRGLTLADTKVAIATFDPAKAFGFSAFGPLKFRIVNEGVAGDWQPLATLVRLPVLQGLQCPAEADQSCKLTGSNLFLVKSVASDKEFKQAVDVPAGFPGRALPVPRPGDDGLYIKLRDDPSIVNVAALVAEHPPAPPVEITPAAPTPAPAAEQNALSATSSAPTPAAPAE